MFSSLKNIFKVPDLRNKIVFTLLMIALYRLGSNVTVPGIDFGAVQDLQAQAERGGVLGFLNLFSGGALTQMAVFALGIMPYITSSIIMQLLAVVIPKIEQWQKQGAVGQKKITQWTRYMTVGLALLQATGITYQFNNGLPGRRQHHRAPGHQVRRPPRRPHRAHHHRRHRHRDVDGRADHPAGHRQRDVDPDLLQRGQPHAGPVRQRPGGEGQPRPGPVLPGRAWA